MQLKLSAKMDNSCANLPATKKTKIWIWNHKVIIHSRYFSDWMYINKCYLSIYLLNNVVHEYYQCRDFWLVFQYLLFSKAILSCGLMTRYIVNICLEEIAESDKAALCTSLIRYISFCIVWFVWYNKDLSIYLNFYCVRNNLFYLITYDIYLHMHCLRHLWLFKFI